MSRMIPFSANISSVPALQVLLLEDDELLRDHVLVPKLQQFGFEVAAVGTAMDFRQHLQRQRPDIVVLDVGLPDSDGFQVAREMRAQAGEVGIVMLTGRSEIPDRVRGLSEGADAYLGKPVDIDLLVATLHSLARRLRGPRPPANGSWRLDADGWCLIAPSGALVALTKSERLLMEALLGSANRVLTRETLIAALTDDVHDFDTHRLDSLIHRLRSKVQRVLGVPLPLNAVHGEGYILVVV